MIDEYLKPLDISQALEMESAHHGDAVWFSGGSKLNATPTRTKKRVAISLEKLSLNEIEPNGGSLKIGATCKLQDIMDNEAAPKVLKEACSFIYSRHLRNQATIAGEVASRQEETVLLSSLIALGAHVVLADGNEKSVEQYRIDNQGELITHVVIPDISLVCATRKIARSAGGLAVITAAVSLSRDGKKRIVIDGLSPTTDGSSNPFRATEIEQRELEGESLERAVAELVSPTDDIRGSVEYKRYISGVVVADLVAECHQLAEEQYCDEN